MRKILLTTAAMLVLGTTTGCDIEKMESYFAPDRRLPEGSSTTFDNVHSPALNPGGSDATRHAPAQEGSMNDGTFQKVPVTPVASSDGYPSLASVPQKPDVPPSNELKGNMNALMADQKAADASRTNLMNDPNVTVMTSPQTGQLVNNPADAAATASPAQEQAATTASSESGFSGWLHRQFSSEKKPAADTSATAVAAPAATEQTVARRAPVENPGTGATASAAVDGAVTQSVGTASNITTSNGAPVLRAPLQVVAQTPQQEEPVGLEAPPSALIQPAPQSAQAAATNGAAPVPVVSSANAESNVPASHTDEAANLNPASARVPSQATAQAESNNDSFNSWMDQIFGKKTDDKSANNAAPAVEPVNAAAEPVAAPAPVAAAAPAPQEPATTANVSATATSVPVTDTASVNSPFTAPAATAPVPVASAQPALPATATLQQPPKDLSPNGINSQSLPDLSQLASKNAAPVNLVQPSDTDYATSYSSDGYLADSRYASRQHTTDN